MKPSEQNTPAIASKAELMESCESAMLEAMRLNNIKLYDKLHALLDRLTKEDAAPAKEGEGSLRP